MLKTVKWSAYKELIVGWWELSRILIGFLFWLMSCLTLLFCLGVLVTRL